MCSGMYSYSSNEGKSGIPSVKQWEHIKTTAKTSPTVPATPVSVHGSWVSIDGQQKKAGKSSDKQSQIQNQCPRLNRDLEWQAQESQ